MKYTTGSGMGLLGVGLAFTAIGLGGQKAFLGIGLAFLVIGIAGLARSRTRD